MTDLGKELDARKEQSPEETESTRNRPVFVPRVDILENTDSIVLIADMPGVNDQHVDITLEKGVLTINGSVEPEFYKDYRVTHAEYGVGDYRRSFTITDAIDHDKIEATMKHGVLRLTLPKVEQVKLKKISVKTG